MWESAYLWGDVDWNLPDGVESAVGVPGDANAGVGKEDAGRGFVGEVPGEGFYGDCQGCTADKGVGYRYDASDGWLYQGVREWAGCDSFSRWDRDWVWIGVDKVSQKD